MNNVKLGDTVVILTKLDQKVRTKKIDGLLVGTIVQILADNMVVVLLEDGDMLNCNKRELVLEREQK
jgi:translation initiation factor IF-1